MGATLTSTSRARPAGGPGTEGRTGPAPEGDGGKDGSPPPGAGTPEGPEARPPGDRAAPGTFRPEPITYMPALDGLRGAGLLTVMAFHAGFPAASGGALSVSMFFTLSGFLIAGLALEEHARTGRLSLARFWERRARRLLPAALVALAGIVALQAVARIGSAPTFREDLLSTLGYGTNWRLIARGDDYANLFAAPSPLTHFWSLAIEEQFYLAFPLVFLGVMALFRRRPGRAGLVFAAGAAASFAVAALTAARHGNSGLAYYGTHTRAGEILAGVVLAFLFADRRVRDAVRSRAGRAVVRHGAVVALAVMFALWSFTTLATPSLFRGVTLLNTALTGWVVLAATFPGGPVNALLGNWPLRTLGKVSYAGYLVHWPLFLVLDEERLGLAPRPLFVVRVAATVAVAALSYWLVEYPFRRRLRSLGRLRLGAVMAAGAAAVAVAVVAVPVHKPAQAVLDLTGSERAFDGEGYDFFARDTDVVVPPAGTPSRGTVLLVGDSVAWSIIPGLAGWNDDHPDRALTVDTHISFGCPLSGPGPWMGPDGVTDTWEDCGTWLTDLPRAAERTQPDVVVIVMGLGDIGGRQVEGEWREFGDPVFDDWFAERVDEVADTLSATGAEVVWLTYPDVLLANSEDPTADPRDLPLNDPGRIDTLNGVIRDTVAGRDRFHIADMNAWVRSWPGGQFDRDYRDGVHFTLGGTQYAGGFVAPHALAAITGGPPPGPAPYPPS